MQYEVLFEPSMLQSLEAESLLAHGVSQVDARSDREMRIQFYAGEVFLLSMHQGERYLLTNLEGDTDLVGEERLWVLPTWGDPRLAVEVASIGAIRVRSSDEGIEAQLEAGQCTISAHPARPRADVLGNAFSFAIQGGAQLEETLAAFYWGTMLPSVVERTRAKDYADWRGFVVSTLQLGAYAGTYPDVDHEFQCKGRLAMAGGFDLDVVRRMMELQLRMMREDPIGLWRNPCAIQPSGAREYHVRRNSMDGKTNAEMFLVTGNVEVLETAWHYVSMTKDFAWARKHIESLEGAASLIEHLMDASGRLWSDVFYEDQVMKDGTECMSQAMAANGLRLLADLEQKLNRETEAARYLALSSRLAQALIRPVPHGFWDETNCRFVDWLDRDGVVHDHLHLLANVLPVVFGYATEEQARYVRDLIERHLPEYQRFPTFLSAAIADYTDSEIGDGGPYDLCAAGRYWCWDAAYWARCGQGSMLFEQLMKLAAQARVDQYRMGERYDMNHVYYIDDKNWHGAAHYYEYPCVFAWVLIQEYLGISCDLDADVAICPRLASHGTVRLEAHGLTYTYAEDHFELTNRADRERGFKLDLRWLYRGCEGALRPEIVRLAKGQSHRVEIGASHAR